MLSVGWFSSGRGEGSKGLLRSVQNQILEGKINASIRFVFSNREPGESVGSDSYFELVRSYGIPLITFSSKNFHRAQQESSTDRRIEYDRKVMQLLRASSVDVCFLAGYMRIVGQEMCLHWPLINLHPALPNGPIGTWQKVTWQLIETKAERTGAMAHLATDDLDRGPVVAYFTMPLRGPVFDPLWEAIQGKPVSELKATYGEELPLFQLIRHEEYQREPHLLTETLKAIALERISIRDGNVLDTNGQPIVGLCLDKEIENAMAST